MSNEYISRRELYIDGPQCGCEIALNCSKCKGNACCYYGVKCENPQHPAQYYGSSILMQTYCPSCSYVVTDKKRLDLGSDVWCSDCVNITKLYKILDSTEMGKRLSSLTKLTFSCDYPDKTSVLLFNLKNKLSNTDGDDDGERTDTPIIGILIELYYTYKQSSEKDDEWREQFKKRIDKIDSKLFTCQQVDKIESYLTNEYITTMDCEDDISRGY